LPNKERLDVLLVSGGFFESRERAQAVIMTGAVKVDGQPALKAGTRYPADALIEVAGDPLKYVSRGGLKLERALDEWSIDLAGAVCVDIGASTGGFTDLMLRRGARRVYAIDVGYGQLDWKLRGDARVVNLERTNVRYLDTALIKDDPDFISIDVSFISLALVLPVAAELLIRGSAHSPELEPGTGHLPEHPGQLVALIKPQFEAGRAQVRKGGIVRDPSVRAEVIEKVRGYAAESGLAVLGVTESPITGAKGNVEYLMRCVPLGGAG
jgi:23S rRNA (cytidine1920-2'-O)/16S rRNA (cytidine1409-2'-O)-methyltransferase